MGGPAVLPTVFVVMPYGLKKDPRSGVEIDFDDVWRSAFVPAAERADVEILRADEERVGGFVHLAMFERLLLAEVVLADLTLASPNVMYELGIRHATRPRATIPVFAQLGALPFDLAPIRAVPYRLGKGGRLTKKSRAELVEQLGQRLRGALTETATDSPLFQLIKSYPGVTLPHDVSESFQHRVRQITALSNQIRDAVSMQPSSEALRVLRNLAETLRQPTGAPTELLIDLLLAFRDIEAYDDLVGYAGTLPTEIRQHPAVLQVIAFALNRRKDAGDEDRAVRILEDIIKERGADAETYGLLGRVHKDRHARLDDVDPYAARAALQAAIDAYERGFRADMRDYYPGVNAVTLLMVQGGDDSYRRARDLSPVVAFAVAARGGLASRDYWDVAAVLELATVNLDARTAEAAAQRLVSKTEPPWKFETTVKNLLRLRTAHERQGIAVEWLDAIIDHLRPPPV
jgi:hypothetical protein